MRTRRSGEGLVGVLAAMLIVVIAIVFFVTGGFGLFGKSENKRPDQMGETTIGRAKYRALDYECMTQLSQLRQSIEIHADPVEGTFPAKLEETSLGAKFYECPIGHERYDYDPATGKVKCTHPGHEKY